MRERVGGLSVAEQITDGIYTHWKDKDVASWVIDNLSILKVGESTHPVSTFGLDIEKGIVPALGHQNTESLLKAPKLVMSGGFEGHNGHIQAIEQMHEIRSLKPESDIKIVVMLEPDSYIRTQKGREPLINLSDRTLLWSTSGKVDAVFILPEYDSDIDQTSWYEVIHRHISPAFWCASVENPSKLEIITRGEIGEPIDVMRILDHQPEVHSSFISSTREMNRDDLERALRDYSLILASESLGNVLNLENHAQAIYERII